MAVDIYARSSNSEKVEHLWLSFNDDGYYWFLHPLFERLEQETGKYIDLYGDAIFTRDDFARLRALLAEAESMTSAQPPTWEAHVGTQLQPIRKELYQTVSRQKLLDVVDAFRKLIDTAEALGGYIECVGD